MHQRPVAVIAVLSILTFGIYGTVWLVKTKDGMNERGASIPSAWLLIIPVVNIIWLWKYSAGVQQVTRGQTSQVLAFVLLLLISVIGMALIQSSFNKLAGAQLPDARAMG